MQEARTKQWQNRDFHSKISCTFSFLFSQWKPFGDTLGNSSSYPLHVYADVMKRLSFYLFQALRVRRDDWTRLFEENEWTRTSLRSTFSRLSYQAESLEQAMKRQEKNTILRNRTYKLKGSRSVHPKKKNLQAESRNDIWSNVTKENRRTLLKLYCFIAF